MFEFAENVLIVLLVTAVVWWVAGTGKKFK